MIQDMSSSNKGSAPDMDDLSDVSAVSSIKMEYGLLPICYN